MHRCLPLLVLAFGRLLGQAPAVDLGPGITPPKLLKKVEPEFTPAARAAGLQGSVALFVVVGKNGKTEQIKVVSPLGYGLDEAAVAAVEHWVFEPGTKDGHAVAVAAQVEVHFRMLNSQFDSKSERNRTLYNTSAQMLRSSNAAARQKALGVIQTLSKQGYSPALYTHAILLAEGTLVPQSPDESLKLLLKSAEKDHGPALYEVGKKYLNGDGLPKDPDKGLRMIRQGADYGSIPAQYYLGSRYASGVAEPADPELAQRYFRLCAAANNGMCQYKLAHTMINKPNRTDREYIQALAWLTLASKQNITPAVNLLSIESPNLTPKQAASVEKMALQLLRKP